ncbi:MAG: hypothetical protein WB710_12130 [Stellaceae bacterium]
MSKRMLGRQVYRGDAAQPVRTVAEQFGARSASQVIQYSAQSADGIGTSDQGSQIGGRDGIGRDRLNPHRIGPVPACFGNCALANPFGLCEQASSTTAESGDTYPRTRPPSIGITAPVT